MKNKILILLILLIPLQMLGQEAKSIINTDSSAINKYANTIINSYRDQHLNDFPNKNMFKIAAMLYLSDGAAAIFSIGYERKLTRLTSAEIVVCYSGYGSDATVNSTSIRAGYKLYFTEKNIAYASAFLRYQSFVYANDDPSNTINKAKGYGIGCMLGSMLDFSKTVKLDLGLGLFYSYHTPAYNHQFDASVIGLGIYLIPRLHLCFCF